MYLGENYGGMQKNRKIYVHKEFITNVSCRKAIPIKCL